MSTPKKFTVYSQANMNGIDGSSVWNQAICLALAGIEDAEVTLLLTAGIENDLLLSPLLDHPAIEVIDPVDEGLVEGRDRLNADVAADFIASSLASDERHAIVVRGTAVALRFARRSELVGRLWLYLTDFPQHPLDLDATRKGDMSQVAEAAQIVLCQTEEIRTFLESHFAGFAGKCWLLPPSVPEQVERVSLNPPGAEDLTLVYAGKFAKEWNTLEMCRLPQDLSARDIEATVTMIGDKINQTAADPGFAHAMRECLESSPGVDWLGALGREESLKRMAQAHLGLSWRSEGLGDSLELSTKLLEYCAVGTPPLLNRTPAHVDLLGADYPLFADTHSEVLDRLTQTVRDPSLYPAALEAVRGVADGYTLSAATAALSHLADLQLEERLPDSVDLLVLTDPAPSPVRTWVVLSRSPQFEARLRRVDLVSTDIDERRDLIDQIRASGIVVCEGSSGLTRFAVRHKRSGQRLVFRPNSSPDGIANFADLVDVDLVVAHTDEERSRWEAAGWPQERLAVVRDWVDTEILRRPKMSGAQFHLGVIDQQGSVSNLDLAFDLIHHIRQADRRFILFVRAGTAVTSPALVHRLGDPVLRTGVVLDDPYVGEGSWLRKVGFIVSSGEGLETGMASGSVPVVLGQGNLDSEAARILDVSADPDLWLELSKAAANEAAARDVITSAIKQWQDILATEPR